MASLYVKDGETDALARELEDQRGLSKTAAVKLALRKKFASRSMRIDGTARGRGTPPA